LAEQGVQGCFHLVTKGIEAFLLFLNPSLCLRLMDLFLDAQSFPVQTNGLLSPTQMTRDLAVACALQTHLHQVIDLCL
jgi:hypothetical protein